MIDIIKSHNIDLIDEYAQMEPGYLTNEQPTITHSWERILAIIIYNAGTKVFGITPELRSKWRNNILSFEPTIEIKDDPPIDKTPVVPIDDTIIPKEQEVIEVKKEDKIEVKKEVISKPKHDLKLSRTIKPQVPRLPRSIHIRETHSELNRMQLNRHGKIY